MIIERLRVGGGWYFISLDGKNFLQTHVINEECATGYCVVHNPSKNVMSDFPYNWRTDRGIMERICSHGIGHPDIDSAAFLSKIGRSDENVHGCDGCCG